MKPAQAFVAHVKRVNRVEFGLLTLWLLRERAISLAMAGAMRR